MKTRVVGLLALLCSLQVFAQVGVWRNYTSMQEVRSVARGGDTFWAATSGGLFAWKEGTTSYQKFTSADGLQSTDLTAIAIDNNGDVWTGTTTGLIHVYSPGSNMWRYVSDIANKREKTNRRINNILVYGDTILICSNFGLSIFRVSRFLFGDTFEKFQTFTGNNRILSGALFDGKVWAAFSDAQNTNRVASASLALPNILPAESWTTEFVGSTQTTTRALAVFDRKLYAATTSGLFSFTANSWISVDSLAGVNLVVASPSTNKLGCIGNDGAVYTLSTQNVFGRVAQFAVPPTSLAFNAADNFIVGTSTTGISALSNGVWTNYFPNGPQGNSFVSIAIDLDGNVWGASGSGGGTGFHRYDGKSWRTYNKENSALPTNNYFRASVDCNGAVWLSSWGNGMIVMPRGVQDVDSSRHVGTNVGIASPTGLTEYVVMGPAICDKSGNTWFSVHEAADKRILAVHRGNSVRDGWSTVPVYIGQAPGPTIVSMTNEPVSRPLAIDETGSLWGASVKVGRFGLMCLNNRGSAVDTIAETFLTSSDGLPDDNIRCVVVDRDNDIWVGTERGIGIILDPVQPTRGGGIASYKPLNGIAINAIAVDALNQKWVATPQGVTLWSRDGTQTIAQYNVENTAGKLIDDEVRDIAIDPKTGTVYFATAKGLASLTTSAVEPKEAFDALTMYPNPFRIPSDAPLTIDGLVENSKIKILSVDGHLVREVQSPGGRIGFWDGKDDAGNDVASGVYIVVGYSDTQKNKTGTGKVAVLRK